MQVRIATRRSPLALWQAEHVKARLEAVHEHLEVVLVPMVTEGDKKLGQPLAAGGGKGLFLKELEQAMQQGRADIAVHSMKDVPTELPDGFVLSAILDRAPVADALVSNHHDSLSTLPPGATVGTSSLRRRAQLLQTRPDLNITDLRGNVNTRLARLDAGDFDAILLAAAGLERLELHSRIRCLLNPPDWIPAAGQGAIGIEQLSSSEALLPLMDALNDRVTARCVAAERAVAHTLGASCHLPVAAYAQMTGNEIHLQGMVADPDGKQVLTASATGARASEVGSSVAERLLEQGARAVLAALEDFRG